jgi:UDP-N-acetylglucosamine 2-epimerase (non-hydrolysing)
MKMLKIITVVGTRPEIIRLSRIISKLDNYCNHLLVHTGQNYDYELNQIFFDDLGIRKPNYFLNAACESAAETIGKIIYTFDKILISEKPDALLILGDTNSSLVAITAKRRKVPIFHMEAGNRCFDMRVPEEINRRIVDHISDVNLTYSDIARECLIKEGLDTDLVIKTGSPMAEVLSFYSTKINKSKILNKLKLIRYKYFLVSCHREENIDSDLNFNKLVTLLNYLSDHYKLPIIVSAHPRTYKKFSQENIIFNKSIKLLKPFCFTDYIKLQTYSKAVLSDSGTITEESSILNFPALNLRECHERHEASEEASVMMVGLNIERVIQGLEILNNQARGRKRLLCQVSDYSNYNVSDKVLRIIHSNTDYINRVIWRR